MTNFARLLWSDQRGAAAAEMALITPLLIIIMFGSFELGNYFYDNHIVIKAVRDGARYASRRGFGDYVCPSAVDTSAISAIRNVTRTGQLADQGTPRLANWTADDSITVSMTCTSNSSATYAGIYEGHANVPVVRVSATVPYASLFSDLVFTSSTLSIRAESQVPVMGI